MVRSPGAKHPSTHETILRTVQLKLWILFIDMACQGLICLHVCRPCMCHHLSHLFITFEKDRIEIRRVVLGAVLTNFFDALIELRTVGIVWT
jgi:hypothetical protein